MACTFKFLFITALLTQLAKCHYIFDLSSSDWSIYNSNQTIKTIGSVPGGVYSALEDVSKITDILFGNNDMEYRWIGNEKWSYYREFKLNSTHLGYPSIQLVLHGVDTIADVFLNNQRILQCNNMFVRYIADIKPYLLEGKNNITFNFESPITTAELLASKQKYTVPPLCHPPDYNGECSINMLRKMQASFAWDWGPAFPSSGIWKPVEIVMSNGPVIRSIEVFTAPEGLYWILNANIWFDPSNIKVQDTLILELYDKSGLILTSGQKVTLNKNTQNVTLTVPIAKSKIRTWWPNGYGEQTLYKLRVHYTHSEKTVQIGFRTIELIQENVSQDESLGKTFYFSVNGVKIFAKGSNWIPSHVLPEKLSDEGRIVPLLEAGAEAHFNMIRVWGGGVYESDLFYETCDRLGILVWQDFMFACSMYPVGNDFLDSVKIEVEQQVKRLQHHPSIAIWAGNNENEGALVDNWYGTSSNFSLYKNDYLKLYVETMMPLIRNLDPSRVYVTSSPSNGVESEKEGYVSKKPSNSLYGDVHYYNYFGDGWDPRIYPNPRFASEYGFQSLPSFHCLRAALPLGQMKWSSSYLEHRQHSPGGNIVLLNQISIHLPVSTDIKDVTYLSQINQAMAMKVETEKYRRLKSVLLDSGEGYTMGALYWQLNDIWQAPSWASIDYCGNWKMLQYFAKDFFAPIIVSPELSLDGTRLSLYVIVDGPANPQEADIVLNVYQWSSSNWNPVKTYKDDKIKLEDNKSFVAYKITVADALSGCGIKEDCFLTTYLEVDGKSITPENYLFLEPPKYSNYPETSVKISGISILDDKTAELTLTAERYTLFVWLDLNGLQGTFSKNGFHMTQPTTKVIFKSKLPVTQSSLKSITVSWLKRSYS